MAINHINGSPVPKGREVTHREPTNPAPTDLSRTNLTGTKVQGTDEVQLTGHSLRLHEIETTLTEQPSVDQTRVKTLREAIVNGQYRVDGARIASKLLDLENELFK